MFKVGAYTFDPTTGILSLADSNTTFSHTTLSPKATEVLVFLTEHQGDVVSRETLHEQVWAGKIVTDTQVSKAINEIRSALGDTQEPRQYVETLPRRGYKLIAPVVAIPITEPATTLPDPNPDRTRVIALATCALLVIAAFVFLYPTGKHTTQSEPSAVSQETQASSADELEAMPSMAIGVLRFGNLDGDADNDWLGTGIQLALMHTLSRTREFQIPSRRNLDLLQPTTKDMTQLGRNLNVGTLIDGSYQLTDDVLQITVVLIQVSTGRQLWSAQFREKVTDLLDTQNRIAVEVAEVVRNQLNAPLSKSVLRMARYETHDMRAFEYVVKADELLQSLDTFVTPDNQRAAIELLDLALAIDPDYPTALVRKANIMLWHGKLDQVTELANAANVHGDNGSAHRLLAEVAKRQLRWQDALLHFDEALTLEPWNGEIHAFYSQLLLRTFRFNEARKHARIATQIDPRHKLTRFLRAAAELHSGHYDNAVEQFSISQDMGDSGPHIDMIMARALYLAGRESDAAQLTLNAMENRSFTPGTPARIAMLQEGRYLDMTKDLIAPLDCARSGELGGIKASWLAVFGEVDNLFDCIEKTPRFAPYGVSVRFFDHRFKPYWYHDRATAHLKDLGLLQYRPAPSTP